MLAYHYLSRQVISGLLLGRDRRLGRVNARLQVPDFSFELPVPLLKLSADHGGNDLLLLGCQPPKLTEAVAVRILKSGADGGCVGYISHG